MDCKSTELGCEHVEQFKLDITHFRPTNMTSWRGSQIEKNGRINPNALANKTGYKKKPRILWIYSSWDHVLWWITVVAVRNKATLRNEIRDNDFCAVFRSVVVPCTTSELRRYGMNKINLFVLDIYYPNKNHLLNNTWCEFVLISILIIFYNQVSLREYCLIWYKYVE